MEDRKTMAERLSALREFACLTQDELASRSGVSRATISRIEAGEDASAGSIRKLAEALGVDPGWLRTGKKTPMGGK